MAEDPQSSGRREAAARPNSGARTAASVQQAAAGARTVVSRRLADHAARFPDLVPLPLDTSHLDERDAALAHAIEDAALRRWLTIAYLLDLVLRQPFATLQATLQGILLAGAAQILFLDRIPPHAAINESVEIAKRAGGRGAAGLVNAVLRRLAAMRGPESRTPHPWLGERDRIPLSDGGSLRLVDAALPADGSARLAVATSHPDWLLERWRRARAERTRDLALHSLAASPTILNVAFAHGPLPPVLTPHQSPEHRIFTGTRAQLSELLRTRTDLWVQDPASSAAITLASHLRPRTVIDLCAGQGTKTHQLAATFPEAVIVATDVDQARYSVLERIYAGHERVRSLPLPRVLETFAGRADLVLLDVPCSNTGVLARRPEARYRAGPAQLERLNNLQRQIIVEAIPLLTESPRGRILYSTCSIDPEENDAIVEWAVKWHRFGVERQRLTLPEGLPGQDPGGYHDGGFAALLA